jgi:transposase-like protein
MASWIELLDPMPETVRIDTLRRALRATGSVDALAHKLGVSRGQVERWINREEEVPTAIFLRAVDVIEAQDVPSHDERRDAPQGNDPQHGG